jgi:hypothetical protein
VAETLAARAIIRISAIPDTGLNRALNGAVEATRRAQRKIVDDSTRAQRDREKLEQKQTQATEREAKKQATTTAREAKRAADAEKRQAEETARFKQRVAEQGARLQIAMNNAARREAERTARTQIREAQRMLREEQRVATQIRDARRTYAMGVAGATAGAIAGGVGLLNRGQGVAGVGTLEERLQVSAQFRQGLIRTGGEAGIDGAERAAVEQRAIEASAKFGVPLLDIGAALTKAQQDFDSFREVAANLEDLARVSAATGEPLADLVGVLGNAKRAFGLSPQEQKDFLPTLVGTSARGSISVGSVSRDLAGQMGVFGMARGTTGAAVAQEFLALTQILGQGGRSASEVETMMGRLTQKLQSPEVQAQLGSIGVNVTQGGVPGAPLTNFQNIASQFASNAMFQQPAVMEEIFGKGEVKATEAAKVLIAAMQRDASAFGNLQFMGTDVGEDQIKKQLADLDADPSRRAQLIGFKAQAETARDMDRLFSSSSSAVEKFTDLQLKYPLLTEAFGVLKSTVMGLTGALVANRLAFGSLARGTGNTSGALLDMNGSVLDVVKGKGGFVSTVGAAGAAMVQAGATFALAYQTTRFLLDEMGITEEKQQAWGAGFLYNSLNDDIPRQSTRGMGGGGSSSPFVLSPEGSAMRLTEDDVKAMGEEMAAANRKDPATVKIEISDLRARVARIDHGDGLRVTAPEWSGSFLGP